MRLAFAPYTLKFRNPAGTSRGVLYEKLTYFIKIWDEREPEKYGIGEAPLFKGLSAEDNDRYEFKLIETLANVAIGRPTDLRHHSSIRFGLEQAIRNFSGGCSDLYFPSKFVEGEGFVTINGLVWMGSYDEMLERLDRKIMEGFKCIKLKIGAIDWHSELKMLQYIRARYSPEQLEIRVDANGGFTMENVFPVLGKLADLAVHSIEQPIPAGYPDLMKFVCNISPVPVALDEELIGIGDTEEKKRLLDYVRPKYVIIKPALCGGFGGAEEWIEAAGNCGAGWWVTSALESNIGLNALAQWVATLNTEIPQGLGTGNLFVNNFASPLQLTGDKLHFNPQGGYDYSQLDNLDWRE